MSRFRGAWTSLNFDKEYLFGFETLVFATSGILSMHKLACNTPKRKQNLKSHHMTHLKQKWEKEMEDQISDDAWQEAIWRMHSSSSSLRHTIAQFKIVHRLHWSKDRLAKIKSDVNPTCDQC